MLRREISEIIQHEMKDPGIGFTTITRVETSKDINYATVFAGVMGQDNAREKTIQHLNNAAGYIQHKLSERIRLRTMPKITFKLDTSVDHSLRINDILEKIARENTVGPEKSGEEQQE